MNDKSEDAKTKLAIKLLKAGAVEFGEFQLKMHEKYPDAPLSPIYLNLRVPPKGNLTNEIVDEIGQLLWDVVLEKKRIFQVVAGLPKAGDPIAKAFVKASAGILASDRLIFLKKEETMAGRRILPATNGSFYHGETVIIIDDLITGADTKIEAVEALRLNGLITKDCLVLVDRQQGGKEELAKHGIQLHSVFTMSELLDIYIERGLINEETKKEVSEYQERVENYLKLHS
jgi:uridine monophosphate synthetase